MDDNCGTKLNSTVTFLDAFGLWEDTAQLEYAHLKLYMANILVVPGAKS